MTVQVVVKGSLGRRTTVAARELTLRDDSFSGHLNAPAEGAEIADDLLVVRGWAVFGNEGPARVEIDLNGSIVGRARLRLPNAQAQTLDPVRIGPFAGFEYVDALPLDLEGEVIVTARATSFNGRVVRMAERHVRRLPSSTSAADVQRGAALRARTAAAIPAHALPVPEASDRPPRLLVFTHQLSLGGGQLYLQELLRRMLPDLASCTVVSPSDGVLRHDLETLGVDVIVTGRPAPNLMQSYEGQVRELSMLIAASGCDVVLVNTLTELPAADASQRMGIPVIWAVHESYEIAAWLTVFYGQRAWEPYIADRLREALGGVSRVIFEAQSTCDLFARYINPARRLVIPYGVDLERLDQFAASFDRAEARRRQDLPADAVVLLVVGQVEERKSQAALVEAFARVASDRSDAVLILVGDFPGTYSDALHRQIESSGLRNRVRLLAPTTEILDWYALADALVSASDVESLPRSMMEAMALGIPVLSADVQGIPEMIRHGENGWLFEPRDMAALVIAMRTVIEMDPAVRRAAGAAARQTARLKYDSAGYAGAYLEIIEAVRVLADRPEPAANFQLDAALTVLDRAAQSSARLGSVLPPDDAGFSMRLKDFNLDAPYMRAEIATFVAEAARSIKPGARVADVGAGDAPYRELFHHVDYITIDWEHSIHGDSAQSDILASAEHLPLDEASIDAVILTEVLEHLADPHGALVEIARVLRPSGTLYLTVPFVWILHELPFDFFRYTPSALLMLLENSGFDDIKHRPSRRLLHNHRPTPPDHPDMGWRHGGARPSSGATKPGGSRPCGALGSNRRALPVGQSRSTSAWLQRQRAPRVALSEPRVASAPYDVALPRTARGRLVRFRAQVGAVRRLSPGSVGRVRRSCPSRRRGTRSRGTRSR